MNELVQKIRNFFSAVSSTAKASHAAEIVEVADRILHDPRVLADVPEVVQDLKADLAQAIRDIADVREKAVSISDAIATIRDLVETVRDLQKLVADMKAAAHTPSAPSSTS